MIAICLDLDCVIKKNEIGTNYVIHLHMSVVEMAKLRKVFKRNTHEMKSLYRQNCQTTDHIRLC